MIRRVQAGLAGLIVAWSATTAASTGPTSNCAVTADLSLNSRLPLLPGEPLELTLRIGNPANSAIQFHIPSEEIGSVRLYISSEATPQDFKKYRGPLWGLVDDVVFPSTLGAKQSYVLPLRVLHQAWRDPFVLNAPGTYRVKVSYRDGLACKERLETSTVDVRVIAPTGNDLVVWNAIKGCVDCAHFLHTGNVFTPDDQVAVSLLRNLAKQYPNSGYTKFIRKQLDALDEKDKHDNGKHKGHDKEHNPHND